MSVLLDIRGVRKRFGGHAALDAIDLQVRQGEFIALLGPSGCGKTTLLRTIAGFLAPDAGSILIEGQDVSRLPAHRRPLNTVFQNYALFPHMTVLDNVSYGPRRRGTGKAEAAQRARQALEMVGLAGMDGRYPREMSGGQQQRVALARAIVNAPKLLLLDEPLSALDLKLRRRMQLELKHLQEQLGISFVFVTHDQEEAMTMADRIVVMNAGRIEQIGTGPEIYRAPATRFVAEFIGDANLLPFTRAANGHGVALDSLAGLLAVAAADPAPSGNTPPGPDAGGAPTVPARGTAVLRPEDLHIADGGDAPAGHVRFKATVTDVIRVGSHTAILGDAGGQTLQARLPGDCPGLAAGGIRTWSFDPARIHLIAEQP
ncbi:ABC transporter ATP-binding protein [Bordetella bronchialis]|uniref:Fe3+/spermidine/putrescine ABC transporter ATP-binding protein n=1 Tax=Bordetella bronchialis TaxID=463025 RepID=A0A193G484_9BORD|nr:ABC transporter ATP-binding protein [Bordetella bronchialis]ANN74807.1 Fe3+/spermidine/putrescine ABC transporter ATP-binding protein [Bordetella bronchialis]